MTTYEGFKSGLLLSDTVEGDSLGLLPTNGIVEGTLGIASETKKYYVWDGSAWLESFENVNNPPVISGEDSDRTLGLAQSISLEFTASDSEGFPVDWSFSIDSNLNQVVRSITNDSDGSFNINRDSNAGSGPNGVFTAKASDGVNIATKNVTIIIPADAGTITGFPASYSAITEECTFGGVDYWLLKFTDGSYCPAIVGNISGVTMAVIGGGGSGAPTYYGGGSGAGSVLYGTNVTLTAETYCFTIGAGGVGIPFDAGGTAKGNDGQPTYVKTSGNVNFAIADGGMAGTQGWSSSIKYNCDVASIGGSGAGGTDNNNTWACGQSQTPVDLIPGINCTPSGLTLYRNKGGFGCTDGGSGSGGGGGAGGVGGSTGQVGCHNGGGGTGGRGLQMPIFESFEACPGCSDGGYFAAGSAGYDYPSGIGPKACGGPGTPGPGNGAATSAENYGSAGGGSAHSGGGTSGDGYQGAVFLAICKDCINAGS